MTSKHELNREITIRDEQIDALTDKLKMILIERARFEMIVIEMMHDLAEKVDGTPTYVLKDPTRSDRLQKSKKIDLEYVPGETKELLGADGRPATTAPQCIIRLKERILMASSK